VTPRRPKAGDVLHITRAASVQFLQPFMFRVIRVLDWPTYDGWVWLDGYQMGPSGDAVARRSLYVMYEGLRWMESRTATPAAPRRPVQRGAVRVS
jgi:hypothetical protein